MIKSTFATAINCMDGRAQCPVREFLRQKYSVDYVDMVTELGVDKILSEYRNETAIASIKKRVDISVGKHYSKIIAIAGHHDCATNLVDEARHIEQIKEAVSKVSLWGYPADVIGIWVDSDFKAQEIIRKDQRCVKHI